MSRCADYFRNFQNGRRCHGNGQNAKKLKLGSQISPKSVDFCIWWPFCTLVTMAVAAILNLFNPQKLPHTTVDIPTKFHEV
jgi:hypothetical protein